MHVYKDQHLQVIFRCSFYSVLECALCGRTPRKTNHLYVYIFIFVNSFIFIFFMK